MNLLWFFLLFERLRYFFLGTSDSFLQSTMQGKALLLTSTKAEPFAKPVTLTTLHGTKAKDASLNILCKLPYAEPRI